MPSVNRVEQRIHKSIADYLTIVSRQAEFWWCHVPNGGARNKAEAAILKGLGVKPGVADFLILGIPLDHSVMVGARPYWMEVKDPGGVPLGNGSKKRRRDGSQSKAQKDFEAEMTRIGVPYRIVTSLDEAKAQLKAWKLI